MKITKEELTDIIRQELSEVGKWNQATANKVADLSKIKTKTMMDLYMVLKNNPKSKREKDAVKKLFDELKKRGELKHIKSPMEESDEVNEMRPHVSKHLPGKSIIQSMEDSDFEWEDYLGQGGYKELKKQLSKMKKVTPQQFDQMVPGFVPGDEVYGVFKNHLAIGPTETVKITKARLKEIVREELQSLREGQGDTYKPLSGKEVANRIRKSKDKNHKLFFGKKSLEAIAKISKLTAGDLDRMLPEYIPGNLIYNLWNKDEITEVNEGLSDLEFVIDQLANSMEHYDEKEFVSHMSKETKYNASSLKKVFNAYWKLGAMERNDMFMGGDAKPWLKKLGIR